MIYDAVINSLYLPTMYLAVLRTLTVDTIVTLLAINIPIEKTLFI